MSLKFSWYPLIFIVFTGGVVSGEQNYNALKGKQRFAENYPSSDPKVSKLLSPYRKIGSLKQLQGDPKQYVSNILSWQMEHGGFGLHDGTFYNAPWDGKRKRSVWVSKGRELGNFDDGATVAEVRFLAEAYAQLDAPKLKNEIKFAVKRCIYFIYTSQYKNGGWPQVYPERFNTTYSNHVTLNDNAMIRIMVLLSDMLTNIPPFHTDLVDQIDKSKIYPRLEAAVNYLLKAQIKSNGKLTIWSNQYHPKTMQAMPARSYELASKSARESVGVLAYLMNWPNQSPGVVNAITAGIAWYEKNNVKDLVLDKGVYSQKLGANFWYRFYELDTDIPFFAGRDGIKQFDIAKIEEERRNGYSWGDDYASKLLQAVTNYLLSLNK